MLCESTVVAILPMRDSRTVPIIARIALQDFPSHQSLLWHTQILALSGDQSQPKGFRSDVEMVEIPIVAVI